jgi:hypothetical protein
VLCTWEHVDQFKLEWDLSLRPLVSSLTLSQFLEKNYCLKGKKTTYQVPLLSVSTENNKVNFHYLILMKKQKTSTTLHVYRSIQQSIQFGRGINLNLISKNCFSFFFFFFFKTGLLYLALVSWNSLWRPDQAGLKLKNPSAFASQVLGFKECTTTAWLNCFKFWKLFFENYIFYSKTLKHMNLCFHIHVYFFLF